MYNRNVAYNFESFEEKKIHKKQKGKIVRLPGSETRRKVKKATKLRALASTFSLFLAGACGVSCFIFGQARLTEYTHRVSETSKKLEECQTQNAQLKMKLISSECVQKDGIQNECGAQSYETVRVSSGDLAHIK